MSLFRKKPIVIDAAQWFREGDHPAVKKLGAHQGAPDWFYLQTPEGTMTVSPGDWIITGVVGEHYPCKPDIFALTYEPATPPGAAATPQGGTLTVAEPVARHDLSPAVSVFPPKGV